MKPPAGTGLGPGSQDDKMPWLVKRERVLIYRLEVVDAGWHPRGTGDRASGGR